MIYACVFIHIQTRAPVEFHRFFSCKIFDLSQSQRESRFWRRISWKLYRKGFWDSKGVNPFRAPEFLRILTRSMFFPHKGFQLTRR